MSADGRGGAIDRDGGGDALVARVKVEGRGEVVEADDGPRVGAWFYVEVAEWDREARSNRTIKRLACCTHLGTNYAEMTFVGGSEVRVHFDVFAAECEPVANAEAVIDEAIVARQGKIARLMEQVRDLTRRLGVAPSPMLGGGGGGGDEVRSLALRTDEPVAEYKTALVKAKDQDLPALFEEIKETSRSLSRWMTAKMIPLEAEAGSLNGAIAAIKKRIFSVELYAGLTESVVEISAGEPAALDEKIYLMQRRCYMDEECLAHYETGGMTFGNVADFDVWLARPENCQRILPFPRTIVAFRVRRTTKERSATTLRGFIQMFYEAEADKKTFLYLRNGERLYRLSTSIEFDEGLFPDLDAQVLASGKVYAKMFGASIDRLATEGEYLGVLEKEAEEKRFHDAAPEGDKWRYGSGFRESERYVVHTKESVHYDDITAHIAEEMARHNRLVLMLQGLLDRSPVMHPHPPWLLWTREGFAAALELVYDDARALVAGARPDFEAYRTKLNASLKTGSVTVGQDDAWALAEGAKETERRQRSGRGDYYPERCRPYGNPGPGVIARVARCGSRSKACTYEWSRERLTYDRWRRNRAPIPTSFTTPAANVLNINAYKPGDFKIFFNDPRTRAEYLKWAPLLLAAEEYHAGNHKLEFDRSEPKTASWDPDAASEQEVAEEPEVASEEGDDEAGGDEDV